MITILLVIGNLVSTIPPKIPAGPPPIPRTSATIIANLQEQLHLEKARADTAEQKLADALKQLEAATVHIGPTPMVTGNVGIVRIKTHIDAKITIDDQETKTTGELRIFKTPILVPGAPYVYIIKATRDGKTVTEKIGVKANMISEVELYP